MITNGAGHHADHQEQQQTRYSKSVGHLAEAGADQDQHCADEENALGHGHLPVGRSAPVAAIVDLEPEGGAESFEGLGVIATA